MDQVPHRAVQGIPTVAVNGSAAPQHPYRLTIPMFAVILSAILALGSPLAARARLPRPLRTAPGEASIVSQADLLQPGRILMVAGGPRAPAPRVPPPLPGLACSRRDLTNAIIAGGANCFLSEKHAVIKAC